MRAGHRDAVLQSHQLGQHLGAPHHREPPARAATLRVIRPTAEDMTTTLRARQVLAE